MIGLVLAGGRSTRVPYKMFLTDREGKGSISLSSIRLVRNLGITPTIVTNEIYVNQFKRLNIGDVQLDKFEGVVSILNHSIVKDDLLVVCADNVYGETSTSLARECIRRRIFGCFTGQSTSEELDIWSFDKWLNRYKNPAKSRRDVLTSPWIIPRGDAIQTDDLIDWLNAKGLGPIPVKDQEWFDLGTLESLKEYYS